MIEKQHKTQKRTLEAKIPTRVEKVNAELDEIIQSLDALCEWSPNPENEPEWKHLMIRRNQLYAFLKINVKTK